MIEPVVLRRPIALLFPGQGVQAPGMGLGLYERYDVAKKVFEKAEELTGFPLRKLCFEGPAEALNRTEILQPAVTTVSWAAHAVWEVRHGDAEVVVAAGHSLGEVAAYAAAGAITWEDALVFVVERGRVMAEAARDQQGGMIAIVGLTEAQVEAVRSAAGVDGGIWLANRNSVDQFVLSGTLPAIRSAERLALEAGARRAVILAIPVAAHSPMMGAAAAQFSSLVSRLPFSTPKFAVLGNRDGSPLHTPDELRHELDGQMLRQVDWARTMQTMHGFGVRTVVELGPGRVLASLATKHYEEMQSWNADELLVQFAEGVPATR
ncbi:MAG TPA: ACP S-malonyltransferase [Candidatus Dormibacteraeota bacterium]|nr:ACP S-malonyltransferase [Candidatus Dormibacteraeota bacterium]